MCVVEVGAAGHWPAALAGVQAAAAAPAILLHLAISGHLTSTLHGAVLALVLSCPCVATAAVSRLALPAGWRSTSCWSSGAWPPLCTRRTCAGRRQWSWQRPTSGWLVLAATARWSVSLHHDFCSAMTIGHPVVSPPTYLVCHMASPPVARTANAAVASMAVCVLETCAVLLDGTHSVTCAGCLSWASASIATMCHGLC